MSQSQSPRPVVPSLTALVLNLATESGAGLVLRSAETTWSDGSRKFGALGDPWKSTSTPQSREKLVLLCACYRLHEIAYPGKSREFRFQDHKPYPISGILSQKTDVNYWDQALFGTDGIKCFCQGKSEIRIRDLAPEQVTISLNGDLLQLNEGSDDVPRLVDLIRQLAGDKQPDDYTLRYAGKRLAELLTPRVTSAFPPENEPSQYSAPPAASDPEAATVSCLGETRQQSQLEATASIPPIDRTSSNLIDHDGERCLVAVHVDGIYQGTGFVVRPDVVVTCWHVACQTQGVVSIDFLAAPSGNTNRLMSVTIDRQHSSDGEDIAFLNLSGALPPGVKVAPIDWRVRILFGRQVRTKGVQRVNARSAPASPSRQTTGSTGYSWEPAWGFVIGHGGQPGETGDPRLDRANSISTGLSGAPLFDANQLCVIGMVKSIEQPDAQFHRQNIVRLRSLQAIRNLYPDLASIDEAAEMEFEERAKTASQELAQYMQDLLLTNRLAFQEVAVNFAFAKEFEVSEDLARTLVAEMLTKLPGFATGRLLKIFRKYGRDGASPNAEVQSVIYRLYLAYAPAVLHRKNQDDVRLVFLQLKGCAERTVLPISHATILELFVAAVCGRPADFRNEPRASGPNSKNADRYPRPQHLQPMQGVEQGFQNGKIDLGFWIKKLNTLFDRVKEFATTTDEEQLMELNAYLETELEAGSPKAVVVEPKAKWLTDAQEEELRARFTALVILKLAESSQSGLSVATLLANPEFRNPLAEPSP
jgi:hypothetical protein